MSEESLSIHPGIFAERRFSLVCLGSAMVRLGDPVTVFEEEDGWRARAIVRRIRGRFVLLDVDWSTLTYGKKL